MGNYVGCTDPTASTPAERIERGRSERIGTNGSASVFIGLLVAAYVLDRCPEMIRASHWLSVLRDYEGHIPPPGWPAGVGYSAGKLETWSRVQEMVDFNYSNGEGHLCTVVDLNDKRVQLGLKFKRPHDPLLDDLGTMFERYYNTTETVPLEPERVQRIAAFVPTALEHLKRSSWYPLMCECLAVFTYAAEQGWPAYVG